MATRLKGTLEDRKKKYDWDTWLNGEQWMLVQGVDFEVSLESLCMQTYQAAGNRGLKAKTRRTLDDKNRSAVIIQARPRPAPKPAAPKDPLRLSPPQAATASDAIAEAAEGGE